MEDIRSTPDSALRSGSNSGLPLEVMLLFAVALSLRLFHLTTRSLWLDEFTSIEVASKTFTDIALGRGFDSHTPPFYYLVLHPLMSLGDPVAVSRGLSVVCDIANVFLIRGIFSTQFGFERGRIVAWLYAISAYPIYYAQEARMYPLLVSLVLIIYGLASIHSSRKLTTSEVALAIFTGVAGMYTHYYFALSLGAISLAVLWHSRKDRSALLQWFFILCVVGIAFLPWVGVVSRLAKSEGQYFRQHLWTVLPYTFLRYAAGYAVMPLNYGDRKDVWALALTHWGELFIFLSTFGLAFLVGGFTLLRMKSERLLVLSALLIPGMVALIVSIFTPLLSDRYLVVSYPFFLLLISLSVSHRPALVQKLLLLSMLGLTSFGLSKHYFSPQFGNEQWRDVAERIASSKNSADFIVVNPHFCTKLLEFYLPGHHAKVVGVNPTADSIQNLLLTFSENEEKFGRLAFWLVERGNSTELTPLLVSFDPQLLVTTEEVFPLENGIRLHYFVATVAESVAQ